MSCIHFKFKSSLEYEKLTFDGLHISLSDLKEAIMKQKKIGSFNQYTLSVVDAQSKKEYKEDQDMVPRNTSVIISRVPVTNPTKVPKTQRKDPTLPQPATVSMTTTSSSSLPPPMTSQRQLTASELQETANLAAANASEEDKVKAMMNQSSKDYDPSRYVNVASKGPSLATLKKHPPPPNYICHRCGKKGHWIQFCPTNGDPNFDNRSFKRSLGTPSNQIISAPVNVNMPGVMLDRHGNLVMRTVDYQALMAAQSKTKPEAPAKLELPDELTCPVCKKLVKDAVIIQCCSESFCYECIQEYLCENEFTCPLCKATDISPETLVPNKALRTAARNFQMKESEQKSVSEARGYVPIVTPQQAMLSSRNLSTAVASSSSASSSRAETIKPSEVAQAEEKKDIGGAKPEETESKSVDVESLGGIQGEEEKPHPLEKRSSPAPGTQSSKQKNRSEVLLDRILSTSKKTPPPPSTSAPAVTSTSSTLPPVAVQTSSALLVPSGAVPPAGLTTPAMAASALLAAAAASGGGGGGGMLNLPRAPTSCAVPGQGAVLTTSAVLPPVVITEPQEDSSKLERIAAELLLSSATAVSKKSASPPPPLSAEEFYRQQKLLKLLTKQTRKRTPSPFSAASGSRSTTPDSYVSHRSYSNSSSVSRSRSHSESSYSSSSSRSRSPIASRLSQKTKKHRHRRRHEKTRRDKSRDKERERKSGGHYTSKRKRKRHLSPDMKEREAKSKRSRHHHRTATSPDRKKHRDDHTPSSLADGVLSPELNLGTLTPEIDGEAVGKSSTSHQHKRRHKKHSKAKHRRRERSDGAMEIEQTAEGGEALSIAGEKEGIAGEAQGGAGVIQSGDGEAQSIAEEEQSVAGVDGPVDNSEQKAVENRQENSSPTEKKRELTVNEVELKDSSQGVDEDGAEGADKVVTAVKKSCDLLVPYQDSSTTEVEGMDEERGGETSATPALHHKLVSDDSSGDQTITEAEPTATESHKNGDGGDANEEMEGGVDENELATEDALMISLHVNDTIDGTSNDLIDAECPSLQKAGREDGELTDSSKDEDDDVLLGPADKTEGHAPSPSHSGSPAKSEQAHALISEGVASPPIAPPTSVTRKDVAYSDEEPDSEKDDAVDLRVLLDKQKQQKSKKQTTSVKKQFASAVTIASGSSGVRSLVPSSSQSLSSDVDSNWSSDEDIDSPSGSEGNSEVEKVRKSSKRISNSKHSSSSSKKSKRKHSSSSKAHREREREKDKKRKRAKVKERKSSSDTKKKSRKEKEREKERLKKRKKHKKSEKYAKYS